MQANSLWSCNKKKQHYETDVEYLLEQLKEAAKLIAETINEVDLENDGNEILRAKLELFLDRINPPVNP